MDEAYLVELNVCSFKGLQTEAVYTCFKNELCCDEGCCPKGSFSLFRIWYFWIGIIALFFIFSGGCKICKFRNRRISAASRRSRNATRFRTRNSPISDLSTISYGARSLEMYFGSPRRNELDELINLRRLLAEQEACNVAIDRYVACQNARARTVEQFSSIEPPSYNSLQVKTDAINANDPPPNYNTVCKDFRKSETQINTNGSMNRPPDIPEPFESVRINMPSVHRQNGNVQNGSFSQGNNENV